jgi:predicted membrane protein
MRTKFSNLLWGLFFIIIGLGFAGNAFHLWNFELFFNGWWTLFIIVPSSISLVRNGMRFWPMTGLIIGIMLLLSSWGWVDGSIIGKLAAPLILVLLGISMIFKNMFQGDYRNRIEAKYPGNGSEYYAIFSGNKYQAMGEKFNGTTLNAVFGGFDLDLRNAIIDEDVVINATAVFGGINIFVPSNVIVKVSNVPIFGGVDNKAGTSPDPNAPIIYLNSTCMFGGIDIK